MEIAEKLGLDLADEPFDLAQSRMGLAVELEHLRELPDYYTRLAAMETDAGS